MLIYKRSVCTLITEIRCLYFENVFFLITLVFIVTEPVQRAEYLAKLQKRNILYQQQQQGQLIFYLPIGKYDNERMNCRFIFSTGFIQQGNAVGGQPRPPNHIITRPQMPGAPIQWMQQQQVIINSMQQICHFVIFTLKYIRIRHRTL